MQRIVGIVLGAVVTYLLLALVGTAGDRSRSFGIAVIVGAIVASAGRGSWASTSGAGSRSAATRRSSARSRSNWPRSARATDPGARLLPAERPRREQGRPDAPGREEGERLAADPPWRPGRSAARPRAPRPAGPGRGRRGGPAGGRPAGRPRRGGAGPGTGRWRLPAWPRPGACRRAAGRGRRRPGSRARTPRGRRPGSASGPEHQPKASRATPTSEDDLADLDDDDRRDLGGDAGRSAGAASRRVA